MQRPAPLSSPSDTFPHDLLDDDTVVQTRRIHRGPIPLFLNSTAQPSTPIRPSKAPPKSASLAGQTFNGFELLELLGKGGVGIVYRARQKSSGRVVAFKLLGMQHLDDEVCVARFLSEAQAAAELRHPNVIRVYGIGECPAGCYYAMELIDGPSLEIVLREGEASLLWAVNLLIRLAETVAYVHHRGVLHRDLKPANILLAGDDRPVLIDFGLVKYLGGSAGLTRQGEILGTPAYMAPEQASEDGVVGPASDVYSLGAILYTLLTRRVPYDAGSTFSTILKVIGPEMPPPVRSVRPDVPAALEAICMKCLSKRPEERYAVAEELADALREFRAQWIG